LIRIPKLALPATRHIAASDTFFAQTSRYTNWYNIQNDIYE
jgi:hypothetical protein